MPDVATLEMAGAVAGSLAPTVTLHDVELVETGVHAGSTGATPVERADLEAMIAAAADPEVDRAAMHPGHFDPRFVQALADGEPAIGWVVPRRIVDGPGGRSKLIGDLVDVPAKLAAVIPKAYARRSIEFSPKVTPSGRAYRAALNGLALLGVAIPAVKGLADVVNRYTAGPPLTVGAQVFLSDTPTSDAVFHAAWWSSGHDGGRADLLFSTEGGALMPRFDQARYQALLAEEANRHAQAMAGLLSASAVADPAAPPLPGFTGLPTPPLAPPAAAPAAPAAPAGWAFDASGQLVPAAAPAAAPAPVAPAAPAAGWPPAPPAQPVAPAPNPYAPVAPAPVAGYPAGWPAPAAPAPAAHPSMPAAPPVSPFPPAVPTAGFGQPPAAPSAPAPQGWGAPAPAAAPPVPGAVDPATGLVATLSAGQLAELQSRAARGDQAYLALEAQQREHYLTAAVGEGRISIAERPAWAAQMQRDMAGTVALLSALTPGRVPVNPLGQAALAAGNIPATGGVPDAAWDAWEAETFGIAAPAAPAAPAGVAAPFAPAGV